MLIINRRKFIQAGSLATASLMLPRFLKAFEKQQPDQAGKILVVVQLSGGNDGLNTVVPYRDDRYYKLRPQLSIQRQAALALDDEMGLHPALKGLKALYDDGALAILNSVGYPNPDRSHFRSMDIWQTASGAKDILRTGWLGRYLDAQCDGCGHAAEAIEVDDTLSLALKGERRRGLTMANPRRLYQETHSPYFKQLAAAHTSAAGDKNIDYLYKTLADTRSAAGYIYRQSRIYRSSGDFPAGPFGRGLKTIAELIISGSDTRVYYISLGSFDTHVNQAPQQHRLFKQLGAGLKVFTEELKKNNRFNEVMVMTFSEFGRRVAQNASGGTDHGTANCMFLLSGGLKKQGILNGPPDLSHLDQSNPETGDLVYQVDFRAVYATLLQRWLQGNDKRILDGAFSPLGFL